MIPKEKAKELLGKFTPYSAIDVFSHPKRRFCKECALIAVDEIINVIEHIAGTQKHLWNERERDEWEYYQLVKKELEQL